MIFDVKKTLCSYKGSGLDTDNSFSVLKIKKVIPLLINDKVSEIVNYRLINYLLVGKNCLVINSKKIVGELNSYC